MTKKELEKITQIATASIFLIKHLIDHHNFSEEEAKDFTAPISAKLSYIEEKKMEEMVKESFDTKK